MVVRKALPSDAEQMIKLRCAYIEEEFGVQNDKKRMALKKQLRTYFDAHLGTDLLSYVADNDGEIVSIALLVIIQKPANPSFFTGKTGLLLNVYTLPAYREQGLATRIIQNLIAEARAFGLSYIDLDATEMGKPIYQKLGFEEHKRRYTSMRLEL